MLKKALSNKLATIGKDAAINIVLVANAFIWYFYAFRYLFNSVTAITDFDVLIIYGIHFLGVAVSAILSASFVGRLKQRRTFLRYWMVAGIILSLAPIIVDAAATFPTLMIVSAVLGVYFGLGMPTCMGYFASATDVGNRARSGGITVLLIGVGFFLLGSLQIQTAVIAASILATWRAAGLILLFFLKPNENQVDIKRSESFRTIFSNRSFLLYFMPWFMFSLVNNMAFPVSEKFFTADFVQSSLIIENALSGIFALVFGFFADFVGRKRMALAGFALLGVGYAVLGLFPGVYVVWWFYIAIDGIAWGAFLTLFLTTIWGDLAQERSSEKYYAIGSLPYLVSNFARQSLGTYVAATVTETTVFSFASVFLFLAVLPLVYAPETLPEKNIKDRELKMYLEQAQKIKAKQT